MATAPHRPLKATSGGHVKGQTQGPSFAHVQLRLWEHGGDFWGQEACVSERCRPRYLDGCPSRRLAGGRRSCPGSAVLCRKWVRALRQVQAR